MPPQVSVAIKSYNHAKYIRETIQSVLDQSFQDFEIVITDDGSTDGTPDIIREFRDPRIHLNVFAKNRGISHAMNATIARSQGEFIAILNSDDFALPGRLERQTAFLAANPSIGAVFGLPRTVNEEGQLIESFLDFTIPFSLPDFSRASLLRYFFFHSNCLCAPTALVRRAVYAQVGSYDPRLTNLQDLDMWVRICAKHDIHILREELTAFRIRADHGNMSAPRRDTIVRCIFEFAQILRHYREMSPEVLKGIFASDLGRAGISTEQSTCCWLAELALLASSAAHQFFALQTMFHAANSDNELFRLRDLTGNIDLFGTDSRKELDALKRAISAKDEYISELNRGTARISSLEGAVIELVVERDSLATAHNGLIVERDALAAAHNGLIVERNALAAGHNSLIVERDALAAAHNGLIVERDALTAAHNSRIAEWDALDAAYRGLLVERDTLAVAHDDLIAQREALAAAHNGLIVERATLAAAHNSLIADYDVLVTAHKRLVAERTALAGAHDNLIIERDALTRVHHNLVAERDTLAAAHKDLSAERSALAEAYDRLIADHDALVAVHNNLTRERDALAQAHTRLAAEWNALLASRSWRLTAPLRFLCRIFTRQKR